jgi:hypothetical protein
MTNALNLRRSASGKYAEPIRSAGIIGWNAGAPLTLTLQATGHRPGLYVVGVEVYVRQVASAGNLNATIIGWNQPGLGSTSQALAPSVPTVSGNRLTIYRTIPSTGLGPIIYQLTPAGITGSPIIDIGAYALLTALHPLS